MFIRVTIINIGGEQMKFSFKKPLKAIKQGTSVYVGIPQHVREMLNIEKGDLLNIEVDGDKIIYTKVKEN